MAARDTELTTPPRKTPGDLRPREAVDLPVVRLEGAPRRLHGAAWAKPFPPAAAAMPISRSRLTALIGRAIAAFGAALVLVAVAGATPTPASPVDSWYVEKLSEVHGLLKDAVADISLPWRIASATVMVAILAAILVGHDAIDRWWLGVRSAPAARRWPPVTVFGVFPDRRPGRQGSAIVALHPRAHGQRHYIRRGVVLRELGAVSDTEALAWHQQLEDINQRAASGRQDTYQLVLTGQASAIRRRGARSP